MPRFNIEVPSEWPDHWPAANLRPGDLLVVTLDDDNGDLVDLSAPLVNVTSDELDSLLDHLEIGSHGQGPKGHRPEPGASASTNYPPCRGTLTLPGGSAPCDDPAVIDGYCRGCYEELRGEG